MSSAEKQFKKWMLEKIEEILEESSQMSQGSCPFCCGEEYPVNYNGARIEYGEDLDDAEEWHVDHYDDCLVNVLEKYYKKIDERGLWC